MPNRPRLFRIAITGGPCGGKTIAVGRLGAADWGGAFDAYPVQEVASIIIATGLRKATTSGTGIVRFQRCNMQVQRAIEDAVATALEDAARTRRRSSFTIAGFWIPAGFLPRRKFEALMEAERLSVGRVLRRYDMVVHMVTAASGAERFYTRKHAVKRFESLEAARKIDARILEAWSAHPRLVVVKSRRDFEDKIEETIAAVREFVGEANVTAKRSIRS